jgi:antitoxin component YwqK of YwqJK toxin-antitoxin module
VESYTCENNRFAVVDSDLDLDFQEGVVGEERQLTYSNGAIKMRSCYLEGQLHGPTMFYSPKGQLLAKSWFIHGKQEGKAWRYYLDGSIYSVEQYRHGLWEGEQQFFYRNGRKKSLLNYVKGHLHQKTALFEEDGTIKREVLFQHGVKKSCD